MAWKDVRTDRAAMVIHCGGEEVDRDSAPMEYCPPAEGRWHPISHRKFLDFVDEGLAEAGMKVSKAKLAVGGKNHARFFGVYDIDNAGDEDWGLAFGLRNSTDQSMSAGLLAGERVWVCDNLGFHSELVVTRRHTRHILKDLPDLITKALMVVPDWVKARKVEIEDMQNVELEDGEVHDVIMVAARRGIIGWRDIKPIQEAWHQPEEEAFEPRTVWSLYNAFTSPEALGKRWDHRGGENSLQALKLNALISTEIMAKCPE